MTEAEALPADEQVMLEELLRQRRIEAWRSVEAWRSEMAAEARAAARNFRAGKLKSQSAEDVIAKLNRSTLALMHHKTRAARLLRSCLLR